MINRTGRLTALFAAALSILLQAGLTRAQSPFGGGPSKPKITLSVRADALDKSGQFQGVATVDIQQGWHINSHKPLDEYLIPTELKITSPGVKIKSVTYPPHVERTFSFSGDSKVAVYEGTVQIPFTAVVSRDGGSAEALLHYQSCNDSVCLPPADALATFSLVRGETPAVATTTPTATASTVAQTPSPDQGKLSPAAPELNPSLTPESENFTPLSAAPASGSRSLLNPDVAGTLASRGLFLTLLSVFILGLALNLTPCVYPLIPITIAFFSSQSEGRRSVRAMLSVAYVLGIAVTYSALGVFSAMTGSLFGAWLQLPAVLIFFSILMLVLAASMFGLYDIQVPHFISDRAGARGGILGALTMGLLVGIVAAPCVGPFVISLIALVGQSGSVPLGFILFFTLALGLGVPYLLLGIFSSALESIPRSGMWMVQVKKAMAFILIAMAFYFLRPLIGESFYRWGAGLSLVVGALFLFFTGRSGQRGGEIVRVTAGILMLIAGIFFLMPRHEPPGIVWTPFDQRSLATAQRNAQPVMIDFYADWCLPCKELDRETFSDDAVSAEAHRFIRLKADLTHTAAPATVALSKRFGILGVPTIVFIDSRGNEVAAVRLTGFEKPDKFLQRLKQVR